MYVWGSRWYNSIRVVCSSAARDRFSNSSLSNVLLQAGSGHIAVAVESQWRWLLVTIPTAQGYMLQRSHGIKAPVNGGGSLGGG